MRALRASRISAAARMERSSKAVRRGPQSKVRTPDRPNGSMPHRRYPESARRYGSSDSTITTSRSRSIARRRSGRSSFAPPLRRPRKQYSRAATSNSPDAGAIAVMLARNAFEVVIPAPSAMRSDSRERWYPTNDAMVKTSFTSFTTFCRSTNRALAQSSRNPTINSSESANGWRLDHACSRSSAALMTRSSVCRRGTPMT
jgi:hypothetical protein